MIQARLNSQRCPRKMIKPFADTSLMQIAIDNMKNIKSLPLDNFYLSIYEPELIEIANNNKINYFKRSEKSANSEGTPLTEIYEWWDRLPYEYVVMVNACAPLLTSETIDNFVESYLQSDSDGMFGVIEKKNYIWDKDGEFLTPLKEGIMNTKTADPVYEAAHCLYAGKMSNIGKGIWMGDFSKKGDIELVPMPEEECFDIDYQWQFDLGENLYRMKVEK
jgi:CMP-N-acetylneuraminic acid synthetase